MGWSISPMCNYLRKKMEDNFAGCAYSVQSSVSPIIINHRGDLSGKEMIKYAKLFPKNIRVEFQRVEYDAENYTQYGRGDYILYDRPVLLTNIEDERRRQKDLIKKMREEEDNTPTVYYEIPKEVK